MFNEAQIKQIENYLVRYNGNLKLAIAAVRSDERAEMETAAFKARIAAAGRTDTLFQRIARLFS